MRFCLGSAHATARLGEGEVSQHAQSDNGSRASVQLILPADEAIAMDDDTICHHLEQLAAHLEVSIRYEPSAGKAGYCVLNGERTIFIDPRMTLRNRAAALARMLCQFDCEGLFLPPAVRGLLDACRAVEGNGDSDERPATPGSDAAPTAATAPLTSESDGD